MILHFDELEALLAKPIGDVRKHEQTAFDGMLARTGGRIILFGAGTLGTRALACLRQIGVEPLAFSDNAPSKWGTTVDGVHVLSPADAAMRYGKDALIVVTIWSIGHSYRETRSKLQALGCTNVAPAGALRWKFADELLPDFCQDLPHKVYEQAAEVRRAALLWSDEESRREYVKQVRWRALGDFDVLSPPHQEESYFPSSIFNWSPEEVFVDCGAYDGDTARRILERENGCFQRIVALEPDPSNFERMRAWQTLLPEAVSTRIRVVNSAAGARTGKIRFHSIGTAASAIDANGELVVDCISLDTLLGDMSVSYIKMDIEGAELDALDGAAKTIRRNQPVLAVCLYHRQDHLWRIPLFIRRLHPDYRFFLRPHADEGRETVCYAVPEHRVLERRGSTLAGETMQELDESKATVEVDRADAA